MSDADWRKAAEPVTSLQRSTIAKPKEPWWNEQAEFLSAANARWNLLLIDETDEFGPLPSRVGKASGSQGLHVPTRPREPRLLPVRLL